MNFSPASQLRNMQTAVARSFPESWARTHGETACPNNPNKVLFPCPLDYAQNFTVEKTADRHAKYNCPRRDDAGKGHETIWMWSLIVV